MFEDSVPLKEITLQKIKFGVVQNVFPQDLKYEVEHDIIHDRFIHYLTWNLLGKEIETKKYPATWWDAFKNRWYPQFLKKRFPVSWDHFRLYNICPHINHVFPSNSALHLNWVEDERDFTV